MAHSRIYLCFLYRRADVWFFQMKKTVAKSILGLVTNSSKVLLTFYWHISYKRVVHFSLKLWICVQVQWNSWSSFKIMNMNKNENFFISDIILFWFWVIPILEMLISWPIRFRTKSPLIRQNFLQFSYYRAQCRILDISDMFVQYRCPSIIGRYTESYWTCMASPRALLLFQQGLLAYSIICGCILKEYTSVLSIVVFQQNMAR